MFDVIIVGAGFAGSVLAERIANKLKKKVLIIEKRNHIGGNCYDFRTQNGLIVHKYGPHLFHTSDKEVWNYLSLFTEWNEYQHRVLGLIDGQKVPIPFNLNSLRKLFPSGLAKLLEEKLLQNFPYGEKVPILKLKQAKDKDLKFLADFIYEKVFKNYTLKQWGIKLEDLTEEVTSRVPIIVSRDDRYFPSDKYQAVPKEGYSKLFKNLLSSPNIKILLNTDFKEILKVSIKDRKIYFLGNEFKGILIFTAPIDELFNYKFGYLPYRSLNLKFETLNYEYYQEVATVNYPNNYDFTRITEFKHIHKPEFEFRKTVILKEFPKNYKPGTDIPYYPLFTGDAKDKYLKYLDLANDFKERLVLVGRLAEYRYYDMDDIVKRALEVFEERFI